MHPIAEREKQNIQINMLMKFTVLTNYKLRSWGVFSGIRNYKIVILCER